VLEGKETPIKMRKIVKSRDKKAASTRLKRENPETVGMRKRQVPDPKGKTEK